MNYSRNLVFIAACAGMAFFGVAMLTMGAVLPDLTRKFALDDIGASSLVVLLPFGILVGSALFGPIVDKFGYKWLLIASSVCAIAGLGGLAYFNDIGLLRFCIFLIGLGGGILNGETNALVADIYDDRQRGAKLSILGVFYCIGALGLPVLFAFLSTRLPFEAILGYTAGFMSLFVVYFLMIRFPQAKAADDFSLKKCAELIRQPALLLFSFILFFQSGFEGLTNNWSTTYLGRTTAMSEELVMFSLTWLITGILIGRLILGFLLSRVSETLVLYVCLFIALAGIVFLGLSSSVLWINASMVLIGLGTSATFPVVLSYVGKIYKRMSGTAFSIALFIALVGNTILNYLMGVISQAFGIDKFPVVLIVVVIAMILLLAISMKQIKNPKKF